MNDLIANFAGIIITGGLCAIAVALLLLHAWLRVLENTEGEDDDEV